jgi:CDP-glucose 4,6-dehydratase
MIQSRVGSSDPRALLAENLASFALGSLRAVFQWYLHDSNVMEAHLNNLCDAFAGKSVFVTGHTGFKGSWLCLWLAKLGARVTGYALDPPTQPSHFEVAEIEQLLDGHHIADIRDAAVLEAAMRASAPDLVLHLAAQSVVRESYAVPRETFEINAIGTAGVLDAVRKLRHPCSVVCVTSDKCYENVEQVWGYRECDAMGEHDPYGGSKGAAELVIRSYRHSFFPPERLTNHGVKLASARAGNVIGGGDWTSDALIVDIVKALAANQPVRIRKPNAFRPWQHVLQALSGYLTLAARLMTSDNPVYQSGWNIGPAAGNELPVREIVELFLREWGHGSWIDVSRQDDPHEAGILRLAIDKAIWQLNWRPGWDVTDTLRQTVRWYREFHNKNPAMRSVSSRQIDEYSERIGWLQTRPLPNQPNSDADNVDNEAPIKKAV